jgi:fatty acid desaturase
VIVLRLLRIPLTIKQGSAVTWATFRYMFRFAADRLPVSAVLAFSVLDFSVYLLVDNVSVLLGYLLLMVIPRAVICAWNHHHQHTMTFKSRLMNRLLEFFYALHTGVTTHLWVLHHVHGHHRNFLDQKRDQSRWMRADGATMGPLEYTFSVAGTAYFRGFSVGKKFPRLQREYLTYGAVTILAVALFVWFRPLPGLLVFVLPMIISLLFTSWVTHDHHAGLDTDDQFEASFNNLNPLFNMLTGNLGYHTAHHYRQGMHWSKLPELHERIKDQIPSELIRNQAFVMASIV